MKRSGGVTRRLAPVLLVACVLGTLMVGPYAGTTLGHIGEAVFASVIAPTGVAATPGRLLVTRPYCGDPRQVVSIDGSGVATVFATLDPRGGGCFEEYIAVAGPADPSQPGFPSPTRGGFPSNYAYVTQGSVIKKISPEGVVSTFTTIPSCQISHNGITFDTVGTFGFNMIVTCADGAVWKVASTGAATLIANVATALGLATVRIENPDVAPLSFAPYGGHIFVAAEVLSKVLAVSPSGTVSSVANWPSAEGVHFIPDIKCNFDTSGGTFFTVTVRRAGAGLGSIYKFPLSAFAGKSGQALVTSEFGAGIGLMKSTGAATITPTLFHGNIGQHEGSTFTDCTVPLLLRIDVEPGSPDHPINPRIKENTTVAILSTPAFNAITDVIISSIRFGVTGTENSIGSRNIEHKDVDGDGRLDLVCLAATARLGITTPGIYSGPLILKLLYNAAGGDPIGEGLD